jgi:hypothetical protein
MALWGGGTHALPIDRLCVDVMPQIGVQSTDENAGKSVLLECLATLSYRGALRSIYSPATVFRAINAYQRTFCLVDIHNYSLESPSELKNVIDACHRRSEAFCDRCEPQTNGGYIVRTLKCLGFAGLGIYRSGTPGNRKPRDHSADAPHDAGGVQEAQ